MFAVSKRWSELVESNSCHTASHRTIRSADTVAQAQVRPALSPRNSARNSRSKQYRTHQAAPVRPGSRDQLDSEFTITLYVALSTQIDPSKDTFGLPHPTVQKANHMGEVADTLVVRSDDPDVSQEEVEALCHFITEWWVPRNKTAAARGYAIADKQDMLGIIAEGHKEYKVRSA